MSMESALEMFERTLQEKHGRVLEPEQLLVIRLTFQAGFECGKVDLEALVKSMPLEKALPIIMHPAVQGLIEAKREIVDLEGLLAIEKAKNSSR